MISQKLLNDKKYLYLTDFFLKTTSGYLTYFYLFKMQKLGLTNRNKKHQK